MQWGATALPPQIFIQCWTGEQIWLLQVNAWDFPTFLFHYFFIVYVFNCTCSVQAKIFPYCRNSCVPSLPHLPLSKNWFHSNIAKWHLPSLTDDISTLIKQNTNHHGMFYPAVPFFHIANSHKKCSAFLNFFYFQYCLGSQTTEIQLWRTILSERELLLISKF